MRSLVQRVKRSIVPQNSAPRVIRSGPFAGIRMEIDPRYQFQLYLGLFERETYKALSDLSRGIATAIDIGAGEGEYTLFCLLHSSATSVISFEPGERLREKLAQNLNMNNIPSSSSLVLSANFVGAHMGDNLITLDSIADRIESPCLIKLDIDGGEVDVLKGADKLLDREDVRLLIETHSLELEQECIRILQEKGYETEIITPARWRVIVPETRPIAHNQWLTAIKKPIK